MTVVLGLLRFGAVTGAGLPGAFADDGVEGTFDPTEIPYDLSEESADLGKGAPLQGGDTSEADPWCHLVPDPGPNATHTYKTNPVTLKADEYRPSGTGPFPVMVLAHGGGWAKGCRYSMAGVANLFAHHPSLTTHFIAITIDYRLACNSADPAIDTFVNSFCDWTYDRVDPVRGLEGAPIWDIQDAVAWVKDTWANLPGRGELWNGAIVLMGGSAGGNMSLMAATLAQSGSARPDALVALSGFPRFTRYINHGNLVWGCDAGQSNDTENCALGEPSAPGYYEGGINRYLPCPAISDGWESGCDSGGSGLYEAAGPYDVVDSGDIYPPSTYLANGGGPDAGVSPPELAALQASIDFNVILGTQVDHHLCTVNTTEHGTHLLGRQCNDETGQTVRQSIDNWLATIVCIPPFETCNG